MLSSRAALSCPALACLPLVQVRQSVEPLRAAGYANFQYKHDVDQKRRRQLDAAFRRPNEVIARERELIRELRALEAQIKRVQARGVGALGAKALVAAGGQAPDAGGAPSAAEPAAAASGDVKPGSAVAAPVQPRAAIDLSRGPRAPPIVVATAAILPDDPTGDSAFALDDLFPYGCGPMGSLFGRRDGSGKLGASGVLPAKRAEPHVASIGAAATAAGAAAMTDGEDASSDAGSLPTQDTVSLPDSDAADLLAIRSLATKSRPAYRFPAGASRAAVAADPTAGIAGSASVGNPFAGVALRSVQLAAPIDGLAPESRSLAKANAIIQVRACRLVLRARTITMHISDFSPQPRSCRHSRFRSAPFRALLFSLR